MTDYQM